MSAWENAVSVRLHPIQRRSDALNLADALGLQPHTQHAEQLRSLAGSGLAATAFIHQHAAPQL